LDKEGKYLYCIIETNSPCNFGPIGIGGRGDEVTNICCEGLSAVISNTPMTKYSLSRENLITHEKVIEKVMKEFTVLPVRFCTIADSVDEIRSVLGRRNREFKSLLRDMDGKVELGLKVMWKDTKVIYKEIADSSEIKGEKKKSLPGRQAGGRQGKQGLDQQIKAGKLVEKLLGKKKEEDGDEILTHLKRSAYDIALGKLLHERMFLNASFLVDKSREMEFDTLVDELDKKYKDRTQFKYVGPVPPYNFVNIVIKP